MWLYSVLALLHRNQSSHEELRAAQARQQAKAERIDRITERIRADSSATDRRVRGGR